MDKLIKYTYARYFTVTELSIGLFLPCLACFFVFVVGTASSSSTCFEKLEFIFGRPKKIRIFIYFVVYPFEFFLKFIINLLLTTLHKLRLRAWCSCTWICCVLGWSFDWRDYCWNLLWLFRRWNYYTNLWLFMNRSWCIEMVGFLLFTTVG